MEYRGYDSVGIATESGKKIVVKKGVGKVVEVNNSVMLDTLPGNIGIGHTRWATHGKVTEKNAHPHSSNSGKIAIVHNGIVENFEELKSELNLQNLQVWSNMPGVKHEDAMRSIKLFNDEVIPKINSLKSEVRQAS